MSDTQWLGCTFLYSGYKYLAKLLAGTAGSPTGIYVEYSDAAPGVVANPTKDRTIAYYKDLPTGRHYKRIPTILNVETMADTTSGIARIVGTVLAGTIPTNSYVYSVTVFYNKDQSTTEDSGDMLIGVFNLKEPIIVNENVDIMLAPHITFGEA